MFCGDLTIFMIRSEMLGIIPKLSQNFIHETDTSIRLII
ncbi:hypothetical protein Pse7429DRAFT_1395 [Pseudanabaena biceps PCC 7429]|uniref:Uncharacterized protein n=1 Tax=Pseudanabaena biceps PCC 7429 TaxID=927668 RepID=L8N5E3_9CYAN|nr:hypothetical protein Pse7429DRAFT_1395 [Pseudanabaena biceps PCC 7429]